MSSRKRSSAAPHSHLETVLRLRRAGAVSVVVTADTIKARWGESKPPRELAGIHGDLVPVSEEYEEEDGADELVCRGRIGF